MPIQTTIKNDIYFPDGCQVLIKAAADVAYTDFGKIAGGSDCTATWEWDENKVQSSDAEVIQSVQKNHRISAAFTLMNLNRTAISKLADGAMSLVQTAGAPIATIPDQVIAAGWAFGVKYNLQMVVSSSDSTNVRTTAAPTLTSVTLDAAGTPEVLTANNDYLVLADSNSPTGWVIAFISTGITKPSPTTYAITIDYGSNTPVASDTIYAGSSSATVEPYALQFKHTDDAGLIRSLTIYRANTKSGGMQFNFKSALSDGTEEMPVSIEGTIDSTRTNGRQLFEWVIENGAE